jgi:CRP-like cAMP-binding protein
MLVPLPGDILGELATLDGGPRTATLQALDTVQVLTMSGPRFATLCQTQPRLAWVLLGIVAGRLRDGGWQWLALGGGSATNRVAALLLDLAVRHGKPTSEGIEITSPATQQELASTVAISRESWPACCGNCGNAADGPGGWAASPASLSFLDKLIFGCVVAGRDVC